MSVIAWVSSVTYLHATPPLGCNYIEYSDYQREEFYLDKHNTIKTKRILPIQISFLDSRLFIPSRLGLVFSSMIKIFSLDKRQRRRDHPVLALNDGTVTPCVVHDEYDGRELNFLLDISEKVLRYFNIAKHGRMATPTTLSIRLQLGNT